MKRIISIIMITLLLFTTVNVYASEIQIQSIKISLLSNTMKIGETQKIIVFVTPTSVNPNLEYESDNPDVLTAGIGTIIANNEGVANVTVKVSGTEIKDSITVKVTKDEIKDTESEKEEEKPTDEIVKVNKITVENKSLYLEKYETEQIVYFVSPDNATNKNVTFKSSNTSVATVDENGNVYAKRSGNATITVKSEDNGATATVRVYVSDNYNSDKNLRNIYITHNDEIVRDKFEIMQTTTVQFGIKVSPSSANKKVNWRSSNTGIATVDSNGKVTGVKKGTCTIYATSQTDYFKSDSVTVHITDYVRYPDKIVITPQENAVYETGNTVLFTASVYPEDTTETDVIWYTYGKASISQNGFLTIYDSGEITVRAYSSDYKTVGEYKFNAVYSSNHFDLIGTAYNLTDKRCIEICFDEKADAYSAYNNIFVTCDERGNGERIKVSIITDGKKIKIVPEDKWPKGEVYIFIKSSLYDIYGVTLGKNLKYKLNIRGNVYEE